MPHFLVPCSCGQKLPVTTAQAGQRLTCSCGREVDVPTLRGLQSLERAGDVAPATMRRWGARQGLVFLGAAIAIASLVAAVWIERSRPMALMVAKRLEIASKNISNYDGEPEPLANFNTLSPADIWLTWDITAPVGVDMSLTKPGRYAVAIENEWLTNWLGWRYFVWGIGAFGAMLIALGLLLPQRRARRRPAKPRATVAAKTR